MANRTVGGVEWTPNPDEEKNQHEATIRGKKVVVFSDRDEGEWCCEIDDNGLYTLSADNLGAALREAAMDARG